MTRPLSALLPRTRSQPRAAAAPPAAGAAGGRDYRFADLPLLAPSVNLPRADLDERAVKVNAPKGKKPEHKNEEVKAQPLCEPKAMYAVTGGPFLDQLSMDDYYPDLAGHGWWDHGATAGTWDTGSRCGANVQLVGAVNMLCRPEQYQFEQTVTHTKSIFNGTPDADNGTTHDDIADSGRDFSKAPARQERSGPVPEGILYREGETPPSELRISMADPPSLLYGSFRSVEWDRTYTTTLKSPAGSRSVTWSSSIVIKDGRVTKNKIA